MNLITIWIFLIARYSWAFENLALNKPAWQQTNWPDKPVAWGAAKAVDGLYTDRSAGDQCSIADDRQVTAEWGVDLQSVVSISHIVIYYRTDNLPSPSPYTTRFAGFFLYVSNTTFRDDGYLCFHEIQTVDGTPTENQTISCPVHGRYVIFYNERRQGVTYPKFYSQYVFNELCEVEVYGCPVQRYYGENCDVPCPENCQEQRCNITTGECLGCVPGYQGPKCTQACNVETYGLECSFLCGNCSDPESCDNTNGTCLSGCKEGVQGNKCQTQCQVGRYGENCLQNCSGNCYVSSHCNRFNGACVGGCSHGWKNIDCNEECNDGKYGYNCNQSCGHCLEGSHCDKVNGTCLKGCSSGFMGILCDKECPAGYFGVHCLGNCMTYCRGNKTCDSITGVCYNGCIEGLYGALCNEEDSAINLPKCISENTSIIISAIVSLVIVLTGSVINFILWKRNESISAVRRQRKSKGDQKAIDDTEKAKSGQQDSSPYTELGALDKPSTYEDLHQYAEAVDRL
ncbi:multiple epidermal growth factor-like domains protein 10 [Saccostrea echinata]|uniref:multiple epidermal growth factor-like domains protein 10 n=1 Tax=Saccostrea echinata TaxID=191078 RepID=UPI002A832CB3|nr:multiple epidermal growth factor-like domains protein 10 [Saccostrea echinata]